MSRHDAQTTKVYVGNLPSNARKEELERVFEKFGKLHDVWVARNPPGFAFVEFYDSRDAKDACRDLDGARCCGSYDLKVELSHGKSRSRGRGGRGGGGGGGRRDYDDYDRYSPRRSPPRRRSSPQRWRSRSRSPQSRRY